MPHIDWTITTGNILEILGIVGGGLLFLHRVCLQLAHIKNKLEEHEKLDVETRDNVNRIIDHLLDRK